MPAKDDSEIQLYNLRMSGLNRLQRLSKQSSATSIPAGAFARPRTLVGVIALSLQIGMGQIAMHQAPEKSAQQLRSNPYKQEVGNIYSRYDAAVWQSPESILADLQSKSDDIRLNALHLLGAVGEDAFELGPSKNVDAELVSTPWQSELRYVTLGDDGIQEAVVAIQVRNLVIVAVAIPKATQWERIAAFKCLCPSNNTRDSYGSTNGSNLLGATVDIGRFYDRGYERYELILSAIDFPIKRDRVVSFDNYVQHEAHFRIYAGVLRRTIAFDRRTYSCQAGCTIQRRWFYQQGFGYAHTIAGAILLEADGVSRTGADSPYRTDLEEQGLKYTSCSTLKFNDQTHRYEVFTPPGPQAINVCTGLVGTPH